MPPDHIPDTPDHSVPLIGGNHDYKPVDPATLPPGHERVGQLDQLKVDQMHNNPNKIGGGLEWESVEIGPNSGGDPKYKHRPVLSIPGLQELEGSWRPHTEFFENERECFLMSFMNCCASFLFGRDRFIEDRREFGIKFRPNPEWNELYFVPPPKTSKQQKAVENAVDIETSNNRNTMIPLTFVDEEGKPTGHIICSELAAPERDEQGMPKYLTLRKVTADFEPIADMQYRQDYDPNNIAAFEEMPTKKPIDPDHDSA